MTFLTLRALLVVMEVADDLDIMHGELLPRLSLRLAGLSVQIMLEQDVQTFITWTHVVTVSRAWYIA